MTLSLQVDTSLGEEYSRPVRMIDEGIAVALNLLNRQVAVLLMFIRSNGFMPFEEHLDAVAVVGLPGDVELIRIAKGKVQGSTCHLGFAYERLEERLLLEATVGSRGFVGDRELAKVAVLMIVAETVTARFTTEQVMEIASHGFLLGKPRLRHDMFRVEWISSFQQINE